MAATIQLLCEKSLRDISIEEIARKACVGKTTIYKWWPSKAHVAFDAFLRQTDRILSAPDTGSARSDILEQFRSLMVLCMSPAGHILGQFVAESQIDKEFASTFRERFIDPMREAVGIIIDRGVERGDIDQNLNRDSVLELICDLAIYRTVVKYDVPEDKLTDEMVSILFGGLDYRCQEKAGITDRKGNCREG